VFNLGLAVAGWAASPRPSGASPSARLSRRCPRTAITKLLPRPPAALGWEWPRQQSPLQCCAPGTGHHEAQPDRAADSHSTDVRRSPVSTLAQSKPARTTVYREMHR